VPAIARIPVILLTGDAQRSTVEAARDRHINGYLVKPIDRQVLKQRLDRVLGLA
jgi:two-component system chemotaxis response regulator CheY